MNLEDKVKEANARLSIKKVLFSLQRKKEEIGLLDSDIEDIRRSNADKEEEVRKLKEVLNKKKEVHREQKSRQLIGNQALDSMNLMIKSDRIDSCAKDREYLEAIRRRTEDIKERYRFKYTELQEVLKMYSELSLNKKIIGVKANTTKSC